MKIYGIKISDSDSLLKIKYYPKEEYFYFTDDADAKIIWTTTDLELAKYIVDQDDHVENFEYSLSAPQNSYYNSIEIVDLTYKVLEIHN